MNVMLYSKKIDLKKTPSDLHMLNVYLFYGQSIQNDSTLPV